MPEEYRWSNKDLNMDITAYRVEGGFEAVDGVEYPYGCGARVPPGREIAPCRPNSMNFSTHWSLKPLASTPIEQSKIVKPDCLECANAVCDECDETGRYSHLHPKPIEPDGWIKWDGGVCPVSAGTQVELRFRDNGDITANTNEPEDYRWSNKGMQMDIVAYRVIAEPQAPIEVASEAAAEQHDSDFLKALAADMTYNKDKPQAVCKHRRKRRKHSHYFKEVSHLSTIDVYRVLSLFNVTDQALGHAIKKLLVAGGRGGGKDISRDIQEAIDTLVRWQEMRQEDAALYGEARAAGR